VARRVAVGFILLALMLGVGGVAVQREYLPTGSPLQGTQLLGEGFPARGAIDAWFARLDERLGQREIVMQAGDSELKMRFDQLGISLDRATAKQDLLDLAQQGTWSERFLRALQARRGQLQIVAPLSFDAAKAAQTLTELAPGLARDAQDARVDLENHQKIPDQPGRTLDVPSTLQRLRALVERGDTMLVLAFQQQPATTTLADLIRVDVSKVLASYETDFKGKAGRRKVNIECAVKYLNGTVIEPGDTFSFNRVVGERTLPRGFIEAPVIVDDVMEAGIGGGVCQVASTLFASAIYGNLEIVRRRSHSRPSGYAPLGLDATVIDHEVDLRIKNPYDVPLLVHAFLPTETTIKVELLGHVLDAKVDHQYGVTERADFVRRVKQTPDVKEAKRKQKGNYGYDVTSVVTIKQPDGKTQRRTYSSKYYPVPEVYWVPSDYDLSSLPPLPEGATETIIGDKPIENETPENSPSPILAEPPS
jgi:vancomycin resistance protein YoaR